MERKINQTITDLRQQVKKFTAEKEIYMNNQIKEKKRQIQKEYQQKFNALSTSKKIYIEQIEELKTTITKNQQRLKEVAEVN